MVTMMNIENTQGLWMSIASWPYDVCMSTMILLQWPIAICVCTDVYLDCICLQCREFAQIPKEFREVYNKIH